MSQILWACASKVIDSVAFKALENPIAHDAVTALTEHGITALGLILGLGLANLISLIGIENHPAGCPRGYLMSRFLKPADTIAVIIASPLYGVHKERLIAAQSHLLGIYNAGIGNEGLIRALKKAEVTDEIITISHNRSAKTKKYLLGGNMDIVFINCAPRGQSGS